MPPTVHTLTDTTTLRVDPTEATLTVGAAYASDPRLMVHIRRRNPQDRTAVAISLHHDSGHTLRWMTLAQLRDLHYSLGVALTEAGAPE